MPKYLVTGASGQLGAYLLRELQRRDAVVAAWSRRPWDEPRFGYGLQPVDLGRPDEVAAAFRAARPDIVIHAAALSRIDVCHRDPLEARRINVRGTEVVAELCRQARCRLVYVSTDLVFDGERGWYGERDAIAPTSEYGRSKAAGEPPVLSYDKGAVVRICLLYGPSLGGRLSLFDAQLQALRTRGPMRLFADEWRTPLSLLTAVRGLLTISLSDFRGLLHLAGPERMSRWDMGVRLAAAVGGDAAVFQRGKQADVPTAEPRPHDVSLDCRLFRGEFPREPWPDWDESMREFGLSPSSTAG